MIHKSNIVSLITLKSKFSFTYNTIPFTFTLNQNTEHSSSHMLWFRSRFIISLWYHVCGETALISPHCPDDSSKPRFVQLFQQSLCVCFILAASTCGVYSASVYSDWEMDFSEYRSHIPMMRVFGDWRSGADCQGC